MLTEICAHLRNYFLGSDPMRNIHRGEFTISGGKLTPLDFLKEGQYFRIVGSTLNDGVYRYPVAGLADESFTGAVWAMELSPSFIALADEIKAYAESDAAKPSPYASESFGSYSYTKAMGKDGKADVSSWQSVFASRLNAYRRLSVL